MATRARTAVVIGGGIAGMCSARVLIDHYDRVVLLERDKYPDGISDRRGVPQSRMFHTLLERGRREIEGIFPGFHKLLDERKMPKIAFGFNCALMTPWGWGRNLPVPVQRSLFCTRGLLESTMRDLFQREPDIELFEESVVNGLVIRDTGSAKVVTGVTFKRRGEAETETLLAELVIDASGASSKAAAWLRQAGIEPPPEHELDPLLTYGGQLYKLKDKARFPKHWWWTHGAFIQRVPPNDNVAAHLIRQESDLWLLTLVAGDGLDIPKDADGIRGFLGNMRSPLIHDMLPYFEPLGPLTSYRLPKNRWKYYELLLDPITKIYHPWFVARVAFARLFLWWRAKPSPHERVAPIPLEPARINRSWRSVVRDRLGIVFRYSRNRLGLTR